MLARRPLMLVATVATGSALAAGAVAAAPKIQPPGVGGIHLDAKWRNLRHAGRVGRLRPGCELAGTDVRSARLKAPLKGSVNLTASRPRRVTDIQVTHGARARGVGIGSTLAQIKAAFPHARVDHSQENLGFTRVHVTVRHGGPVSFAVDTGTGRTTLIGVPELAICE
jgi:hypothetical protein